MGFDNSRVREKFSNAVRALAVGRGKINERLSEACKEISYIKLEEIPEGELKDEVKNIVERVTQIKDGEKGSIRATIEQMNEDEAVELAELVVALDHQFNPTSY